MDTDLILPCACECFVIIDQWYSSINQMGFCHFHFHQLTKKTKTMRMEVEVISKECIKPSSPTPHHLRTFKLSLLDQLIPSPYAPMVLFYPMNDDDASHINVYERTELLKKSLSETLTRFYPLAGKIKDDLSIECNDEGAYYVEARVTCCLSDFLSQPDIVLIHRFLPCENNSKESSAGTYVTNIQVNIFECGGIAIGLCISHKILDGAALGTFLKGWAATARGSYDAVYPNYIAASLFPTNDLWLRDLSMVTFGSLFKKGKGVTKRYVFDASGIATLKAKVTASSGKCPTGVEAVSAFIWKSSMAATKEKYGFQRPSLLTHVVNLRRRTSLPLSQNSVGNLIWMATAKCTGKNKQELHGLVEEVREAISKIDGHFVEQLRGDEGYSVICKEMCELGSKDGMDCFGFTSWCKLGLYEANFGWGKPIWVSSVSLGGPVFLNLNILIETRSGDGIEAWVTLDEQEMAVLERDLDLLKLASLDPSPLKLGNSAVLLHS